MHREDYTYGNQTATSNNSTQIKLNMYSVKYVSCTRKQRLYRIAEKINSNLKGKFKSSGGDGIPIGAFNVPKGSVVVTAGGRKLQLKVLIIA